VLASLRATVLPQFTVEVYFDSEPDCRTHPRCVLVLRDGTAGAVELEFASARDLRAFLTRSRQALTECRFTAVQENESHPELYKLHCSRLSRGDRPAGSWRQTNASVDERHCRQSSHCQIARATTAKRRCTSEPMRAAERSEVSAYGSGVKLTWLVQEELHTFSCTQRAACGLNALDSGGGGCEEDASLYERPHSRAVLTV